MVRKLAKCIREYKKNVIITPLFVTIEVAMDVVIPLLMARIIDSGISQENMSMIIKIGIILIFATGLALFFGVMSGRTAAIAAAGFAKNVRHDMYYNIQEFSFSNIDKFSTASLVTRLTTDITNIQNAFQMIIRIIVRSPLMLIFSLIMSFSVNIRLSFVFLAIVPFLGIGLYLIMSRVHPLFKKVFKTYDRMNDVVQENLHGIRVVKSFVREDYEIKKFKTVSADIYQQFTKAERILSFNSPLMQFSMYACSVLFSWLGAKMIISSEMTTGQLVSMFSYTSQILMSLMMLSMVFVMVTISRTSAERIVSVLDEKTDLHNCENPVFNIPDGSISFQNVNFSYVGDNDKLSLKNINFDIKAGETVGIIGGTGSSKSSLVQLIPRLYDVTEGSIAVGGTDVRKYDLKTLRNGVAMVLQKNELFSGTIKANLRWGNKDAADEDLIHACKIAQADDFIKSFPQGYDTHVEQGGTNVSGGQKQRICIARALLKKPKILILDDSTSAVDTKTEALINNALEKEIPDTTKIIIAQRISSVVHADKIIVMDNGIINAIGNHGQLLANNAIYREVYNSQTKGGRKNDVA